MAILYCHIIWLMQPIFLIGIDLLDLQDGNFNLSKYHFQEVKMINKIYDAPRLSYIEALKYCPGGLCEFHFKINF